MALTSKHKPADGEPVTSTSAVASLKPRESPRVAVFVPTLAFGGVERVMLNLAQGFCERGFEVDIVIPRVEGEFQAYIPKEARLVDLRAGRVLTSLPKLMRYLRRDRPAAVLTAMEHSSVVAIWARAIARVPTASLLQCTRTFRKWLSIRTHRRCDSCLLLVAASCIEQMRLLRYRMASPTIWSNTRRSAETRIHVIHNPIITADILSQAKQTLEHRGLGRKTHR